MLIIICYVYAHTIFVTTITGGIKMSKKVLVTLIVVLLLFSTLTYAKEKDNRDTSGKAIFVMAIPTEIEVSTEAMKTTKDFISIDIKYPELSGLKDKRIQKNINKYFKSQSNDQKKQIIKEAKIANKELVGTENHIIPYQLIKNFKVKDSLPEYLVIGLFDYVYAGGVHGLGTQDYVTIDLKSNNILTLADLFDEEADYKQQLSQHIQKQVKARNKAGIMFFAESSHEIIIKDDQPFYVNSNGDLVLTFNVYEIAPYSSGIIEFTIPKEDLQGYRINY